MRYEKKKAFGVSQQTCQKPSCMISNQGNQLRTDPFSISAQWIFAGIGESNGGMGAVVLGQDELSTGLRSIIEISLQAAQ